MNHGVSIWEVLGIPRTTDAREIRRAYARKLKVTQPEDDAEGFQRLRWAYEYALAMAARAADSGSQPEPRESPQAPPQPAPRASAARTPAPIDSEIEKAIEVERREVQRLFDALRARLEKNARDGWPDMEGDARALTALVRGPAVHSINLQLQVEEAVADLLMRSAPHADHLLLTATQYFEWRARQHESSLPAAARAVLERLDDLEFLEHLQRANNDASRAYETLKKPTTRLARWWTAFEGHDAELGLLHHLRMNHPRLLAGLPPENVSWYLNIGRFPRPSTAIAVLGVIVTGIIMISVGVDTPAGEKVSDRVLQAMFVCLLCLFGIMVFDYFVLKLPPTLVEEKWRGDPPAVLSWGWLVLSIVVVVGAIAMRGSPWAEYLFLGLAALASYGALLVSGPVPKIRWRGTHLLHIRAVRVVLMNFLLFIWLAVVIDKPLHLDPLLVVIFAFVLAGSGVSQPFLMRLFGTKFSPSQQAGIASTGLVLSIILFAAAWMFGRDAEFKPWLVAGVLSLVLLRRAMPHGIAINGNVWYGGFAMLGGWLFCSWLRTRFNLELGEQEYDEPPLLVSGALFFLGGAIYSFGRAVYDAFGQRPQLRAA